MITFEISEARNGNDTTHVNGFEFTGSDSIRIAARALVSAGAPDQPWQMCRGERVDMTGPSLFGLAFTAIAETDTGIRKTLWARHPRATPDAVLDPKLAEFSARWKADRARARERRG